MISPFRIAATITLLALSLSTAGAKTIAAVPTEYLQAPADNITALLDTLEKDNDFKKAADAISALHNGGDANATYTLAVWHEVGYGTQKDLAKAVALYKQAADKDHVGAMNNYGFLLARSSADAEKRQEGAALVKKAMEAGNPLALRNYALFLVNGIGVDKPDPDEARKLLQKGVAKGDADAALVLSGLYENDNGIGADPEMALESLKVAAKLGSIAAQQTLGQHYLNGTGGVEKDQEKGIELIQESSDAGNASAISVLASAYENGIGVTADMDKAVELYTQAAGLGNLLAQNHLGNLYQEGKGVDQDYTKALSYFRAASRGFPIAQYNVGVYYEAGRAVDRDPQKAFQNFLAAATNGISLAQDKVGLYYLNGAGVQQDPVAARAWFDLAAKQGYAPSQARLAAIYENGIGGVARNPRTAAELYNLAAERGHLPSTLKLASMLVNGQGVEKDPVKAYVVAGSVSDRSEDAAKFLEQIKETLTEDQLAQAQKTLEDLKNKAKKEGETE